MNNLGRGVQAMVKRINITETIINHILERLMDLGEHTQTSTGLKALDELRRLRAQNVEAIEVRGLCVYSSVFF
jgi:hypothetical protein